MVLQSLETLQWEDFEERVVFKILRQLSHVTHSKSLFAPMIKKSSYPLKRRQLQYIYSICYKFCLILHTSYSTYTTVVCVNVLFFFFTHCTCLFVLEFYIDKFKNCIVCILHLGLLLHSGAYLQKKEQKIVVLQKAPIHPFVIQCQQKNKSCNLIGCCRQPIFFPLHFQVSLTDICTNYIILQSGEINRWVSQ